ncbi:MAG: RhuM family protein [Candidatus Zapsychrus exili]|nr:RhuM family protein [Candidatus Zapsychrus exili]
MKKNELKENLGEIAIFKLKGGNVKVEVNIENETVWITQSQMSDLFSTERSVVTKHIRNILRSRELIENSVCAIFARAASDKKIYKTKFYNLDMIISVGYRVNSKLGTKFRIWATNVLRQHMVKGYTINNNRLKKESKLYEDLKKAVDLLGNVVSLENVSDDAKGLIEVISQYSKALKILDDYDYKRLKDVKTTKKEIYKLTYDEARGIIDVLRKKFNDSNFVGQEKDKSFVSSISAIYQTFSGKDLYPSVEEKAANLLYFVTKNHSFIDGNKRIAAALFICFLKRNNLLYDTKGNLSISNSALVALTLMIAASRPKEKDEIVKVLVGLLSKRY